MEKKRIICDNCKGDGVLWKKDFNGQGPMSDECPVCRGEGEVDAPEPAPTDAVAFLEWILKNDYYIDHNGMGYSLKKKSVSYTLEALYKLFNPSGAIPERELFTVDEAIDMVMEFHQYMHNAPKGTTDFSNDAAEFVCDKAKETGLRSVSQNVSERQMEFTQLLAEFKTMQDRFKYYEEYPLPAPQAVGPDIELTELPEPIGNFILAQKDLPGHMAPDGMYWHYSKVCSLLTRYGKQLEATAVGPVWVKASDNSFPTIKQCYFFKKPQEGEDIWHGWYMFCNPQSIDKQHWIDEKWEWLDENSGQQVFTRQDMEKAFYANNPKTNGRFNEFMETNYPTNTIK